MTQDRAAPSNETLRHAIEDEIDELLRLRGEGAGELLLVRHAEPARSAGHDPMLSCAGLQQAERLAERLSATWFEAVFSAPERRALQTARIVAGAAGRDVHVLEDLADVEFDMGDTHVPESPRRYAERFAVTPRWDNLPGFECGRTFRRRAVQAVERVLAINPAKRVVVVTHASVINAYVAMLLSVPADRFFAPEHTSVSVVRWQADRYAVRCLNDLTHLSGGMLAESESELFTVRSLPLTSR